MRLVAEPGVRRFASAFLMTPPFAGSIVSTDATYFFGFHTNQLGLKRHAIVSGPLVA
jgi:hypothetical protein